MPLEIEILLIWVALDGFAILFDVALRLEERFREKHERESSIKKK
jgi:hypothetical protein